MAMKFTAHSEPEPASDAEVESMKFHAGLVDDHPRVPLPGTDAVLDNIDLQVKALIAPFEGQAFDATQVLNLRRLIVALPHVNAVGISCVDGEATIDIKLLLNGVQSWINVMFPIAIPVPAAPPVMAPIAPIPVVIVTPEPVEPVKSS